MDPLEDLRECVSFTGGDFRTSDLLVGDFIGGDLTTGDLTLSNFGTTGVESGLVNDFDFVSSILDSAVELLDDFSSSCGIALINAGLMGEGLGSSFSFFVFNVSFRVGFNVVSSLFDPRLVLSFSDL